MKAKRASGLLPISRSTQSAVSSRSSAATHHLEQRALARVHRRFLELRRAHLAEPLEAARLDLALAGQHLADQFVAMLIVARIDGLRALRQLVERRLRQIEMAVLDEPAASADRRR